METKVSVVIPVGPNPAYLEWLPECVESVLNQTYEVDEVFFVFDGHSMRIEDYLEENFPGTLFSTFDVDWYGKHHIKNNLNGRKFSYYETPCRLGVATVFNVGVKLADNECVFMLGSDDKLMPTCIEECVKEYEKQGKRDAWYNVTIQTSSGEEQWIPNHASMVTKGLFKWFENGNGYYGFPPSAGVGGPDALLLSILMKHAPDKIVQVKQGTPLCWIREHEHQATRSDAAFFSSEVVSIRNKETERFKV